MTQAELVAKIAEEAKITKLQASQAVKTLVGSIAQEITNDSTLAITGLGSFSVGVRAARTCINPRTKEPLNVPAKKTVKFKCAKALKDALN
ncbi:MAG: HU family DNA-binding protein [Deltaproteobacteria bacterium]|jgi:DNA-binding protein HU-beta|nr:HU family DNA-binding protein [Deltaproteobacteria bacterium]